MDRPLAASYLSFASDRCGSSDWREDTQTSNELFPRGSAVSARPRSTQSILAEDAEQRGRAAMWNNEPRLTSAPLLTHIPFTSFCPPALYTTPDFHPSFDEGPCVLLIHFAGPTGMRTGPFIKPKLNFSKRLMAPQACKMQRQMF